MDSILRVSQTAPVYLGVHKHFPSMHFPPLRHGGSHATMGKWENFIIMSADEIEDDRFQSSQ